MSRRARWVWLVPLLFIGRVGRIEGQKALLVMVRRADADTPIEGAVVRSGSRGVIAVTDRFGVARLRGVAPPDTVTVAAIGFKPMASPLVAAEARLEFRLETAPLRITDLTVSAPGSPINPPALTGAWVLNREALTSLPAAVEPDALRTLSVLPSVSFSSVLSSRPIIRGYDAAETLIRIDGFDVQGPYHVGRAFSNLPPQALASATVSTTPAVSDAGTLGGVVDLRGRNGGGPGPVSGGIQASLVSASGWVESGSPDGFIALRSGFLDSATDLIGGDGVPYGFQDGYASARLRHGAVESSWTLFGSRDTYADRAQGSGLDWHNVLAGTRWRILDRPGGSLHAAASANWFELRGAGVSLSDATADLENRIERAQISVGTQALAGPAQVNAGVSIGRRTTVARLDPTSGFARTPSIDERTDRTEVRAHLEGTLASGTTRVSAGVLADATASTVTWQPRIRIVTQAGRNVVAALSLARASRSFQVLTDPQAEPTLAFFEVWRDAGVNGVPVPRVDHLSLSADATLARWRLHATVFGSRGTGIGEPRPINDPAIAESGFRFGSSRTRGVELRAGPSESPAAGVSWVVSYVLSWSDRNWLGDWVPWRLDRRHLVRIHTDATIARGLSVFAVGEFASGQPFTPVEEIIWAHLPPGPDAAVVPPRIPRYRYGEEGAGRSAGTYHLSLGTRFEFRGPFGLRTAVAASVTNLTSGPVAPEEPVPVGAVLGPGRGDAGVPNQRRFTLPPIPSIVVTARF